jgi:hypothetical protein
MPLFTNEDYWSEHTVLTTQAVEQAVEPFSAHRMPDRTSHDDDDETPLFVGVLAQSIVVELIKFDDPSSYRYSVWISMTSDYVAQLSEAQSGLPETPLCQFDFTELKDAQRMITRLIITFAQD